MCTLNEFIANSRESGVQICVLNNLPPICASLSCEPEQVLYEGNIKDCPKFDDDYQYLVYSRVIASSEPEREGLFKIYAVKGEADDDF